MVKTLRIKQNMTQKQLAEAVGLSQSGLSRIENGAKRPSLKVAMRIADVLGSSVDRLFSAQNPHKSGETMCEGGPA